jgi:hypothetical protein
MLYRVGVWNRAALSMPEILAWRDLALGSNNGATYLQIMEEVREGHDPILSIRRYGWKALATTHVQSFTVLHARHFLQEDCAPEVAALNAENAGKG